jgi:hypothetical protein
MCLKFSLLLFETFFTQINIWLVALNMHVSFDVKCMLLLSDLNQTCNVSTNFSKTPTSNFMQFCSAILQLSHTDGQTDRHGKAERCMFATLMQTCLQIRVRDKTIRLKKDF